MKKELLTASIILTVTLSHSQETMPNEFNIIGISVETTNANGQSVKDIGFLWNEFISLNLAAKIPNVESPEVYMVYTDYEKDFTGKYRAILGCRVTDLDAVPEGMVGRKIEAPKLKKYVAKGEVPGSVAELWQHIWATDKTLDRSYVADFEVYGAKSQLGSNSEVDIYISVQ